MVALILYLTLKRLNTNHWLISILLLVKFHISFNRYFSYFPTSNQIATVGFGWIASRIPNMTDTQWWSSCPTVAENGTTQSYTCVTIGRVGWCKHMQHDTCVNGTMKQHIRQLNTYVYLCDFIWENPAHGGAKRPGFDHKLRVLFRVWSEPRLFATYEHLQKTPFSLSAQFQNNL